VALSLPSSQVRRAPIVICGGVSPSYSRIRVRELEALLRKLPDPSDSAPRPARPHVGTARKLDAQQTQELIEAHRAGSTAYELGDRFGINRNGRQDPHPQRRPD